MFTAVNNQTAETEAIENLLKIFTPAQLLVFSRRLLQVQAYQYGSIEISIRKGEVYDLDFNFRDRLTGYKKGV